MKNRSSKTAGFTLVEVLVSSFLTVVVLIMLFSVLVGTMNAWEGGTSRLQTNSDARLALDLITSDLQSMVVRQTSYDQEWLVSGPPSVFGAPDYGVAANGGFTTWLTFFAPSLDRDADQEGDIVAISYRTAYQDPIAPTQNIFPLFGLYKSMASTEYTFEFAFGQENIINGFWEDQAPNDIDNPANPVYPAGFLVPNVIRFEVSWWIRHNETGVLARFGPEHEIRLSNTLTIDGEEWNAKIESADISMTLLTEEGMRLVGILQDQSRLIQEYGRTHTTRVPIQY